jgi:hypothetical protein
MTRTCWLVIVLVNFALKSHAGVPDIQEPVTFRFAATCQDVENQTTNITHGTSGATNSEMISISTTTNSTIDNEKLLRMLANSFDTNFPPGASLKLDGSFNVLVTLDTNIVLYASNVLVINPGNDGVFSGKTLDNTTTTSSSTNQEGFLKEFVSGSGSLDYDDSLLATGDGNTTRFSAKGLLSTHNDNVSKNGVTKSQNMLMFSGSGAGSISNTIFSHNFNFILRGGFVSSFGLSFTNR